MTKREEIQTYYSGMAAGIYKYAHCSMFEFLDRKTHV